MTDQTINGLMTSVSEKNLNFKPSFGDKMKGVASGIFNFAAIVVPSAVAIGLLSSLSVMANNPEMEPIVSTIINIGAPAMLAVGTFIGLNSGTNATRNSALKNRRVELKI